MFLVNCEKGPYEMVDFANATLTSDGSKECVNTTGTVEVYEKNPVYECVHKGQLFSKFLFFLITYNKYLIWQEYFILKHRSNCSVGPKRY